MKKDQIGRAMNDNEPLRDVGHHRLVGVASGWNRHSLEGSRVHGRYFGRGKLPLATDGWKCRVDPVRMHALDAQLIQGDSTPFGKREDASRT